MLSFSSLTTFRFSIELIILDVFRQYDSRVPQQIRISFHNIHTHFQAHDRIIFYLI